MTVPLIATYRFGPTTVEVWEDNVKTVFADGKTLTAAPNGDETMQDTIDHELSHTYLSYALAATASYALKAAAHGLTPADCRQEWINEEEGIVMTFVAGLRAQGGTARPWDRMRVQP